MVARTAANFTPSTQTVHMFFIGKTLSVDEPLVWPQSIGLIKKVTVSPLVTVALQLLRHTLPHGSAALHQVLMTISAIAVPGAVPAVLSQVQVVAVVFLKASGKAVL